MRFERSYRACYNLCIHGHIVEAWAVGEACVRRLAGRAVSRAAYTAAVLQLRDVFLFPSRRGSWLPRFGDVAEAAYDEERTRRAWAWLRVHARAVGALMALHRRAAERAYAPGAAGAREAAASFKRARLA